MWIFCGVREFDSYDVREKREMKDCVRRRVRPGGNGVACGFNGRIPVFEKVGSNLLLNSRK